MRPKYFILSTFFLGIFFTPFLFPLNKQPIGILGGQHLITSGYNPAYAALILEDGSLFPLLQEEPSLTNKTIQSVAIHASGISLIGGGNISIAEPAYAAFVSSQGALTSLSGEGFPATGGSIYSVALNKQGEGLLGGVSASVNPIPYLALVASDTTLTQLPLDITKGYIYTVALNEEKWGLVGGFNQDIASKPAYAALLSPEGTVTSLSGDGFPSVTGAIYKVAMNSSGRGILGGVDSSENPHISGYAAFVDSGGTLTQISSIPSLLKVVYGVAINDSGTTLLGGQHKSEAAYAAFVDSQGTLKELSGSGFPLTTGDINSVALNTSGEGIMGGGDYTSNTPYAALIAPDGTLTPVSGFPEGEGYIYEVAINDIGIGLLGGSAADWTSYSALVAPNGTLLPLSSSGFPFEGEIYSASLLLNSLTPQAGGPNTSTVHTLFTASHSLQSHLNFQRASNLPQEKESTITLLAGPIPKGSNNNSCSPFLIWSTPFGGYFHQKTLGKSPAFLNKITGVLVGFDHHFPSLLVGAGFGYAYNRIHSKKNQGEGKIHQEMVCLYSSYSSPDWIQVQWALWGGFYQLRNERKTLLYSALSKTHGWLFSPQLKLSSLFPVYQKLSLEPFVRLDWAHHWQHGFIEKGKTGFNLVMKNQYHSLLRSEIGLYFQEQMEKKQGKILCEQKLSYINQAPFHFHPVKASFSGAISTFFLETGSSKIQHLGGIGLRTAFFPSPTAYPYIALDFRADLGFDSQAYTGSLEIGKIF